MRTAKQFPFKNRVGEWHGERVVLAFHSGSTTQNRRWLCRCSCGTERPVLEKTLLYARITSCGCGSNTRGRPTSQSREDRKRSTTGGHAAKLVKTADDVINDTFTTSPREILKRLGIAY